ncbi:MAG: BNR-repeat neuraminidase N-terminal domain-containing protein [Bacteroidota bacterium]
MKIFYYKNVFSMFSKRTLRVACILLLHVLFFKVSYAQVYVPATGYNSDQVAEGIGAPASSTTTATDLGVDNGNYVFIDGTYQYNATCALATANILPANKLITSTAAPGLVYQLQSYTGNNALRVPATGTGVGSATLTFATPMSVANLYLLCVAGGGAITSGVDVTVTFTDATTQVFTAQTAQDWCNTASSGNYTKITTTNYNRIQTNTTTGCGNYSACQYFAEMALAINTTNYTKLVSSVTIAKTTTTNVMNIYSIGAVPPCTAPTAQPTALNSTSIGSGSITATFTAPAIPPTNYLVVRYPQGTTTITAPVNGTTYTLGQTMGLGRVAAIPATNAFSAVGLTPSTGYDFYIYSFNGGSSCYYANYLTTSPLAGTYTTAACGSLTGTISVGASGTYSTLTSAINAVSTSGLSGNVFIELQPSYNSSLETFPIVFPENPCVSSTKTITIRPDITVSSPLTITSSAAQTFLYDAAKYITIDGRPGGVGTSSMLSIINTNTAGVTAQFMNDAQYNKIMYCDVQGQNTSSTSTAPCGVIYFGTTSTIPLLGNDSNQILNCDIHATTTGFPAIGIASYGATTTTASWNDYNIVSDCNIYDFFSATLASTAVKLDGGSNAFTISNNKIYQTATRTFTTGNQHRAFWLTPTVTGACGFKILNNYIGGNNSAGTGTWTLNGAVVTNFWGMDINHTGTIPSSVQGNTITNISLTSTTTTANDLFRGISTGNNGNVDIGTVTGNTIGSSTVAGAITLVTSGTGSFSYGIKNGSTSASSDTINIYNNTVAGITVSSSVATSGANLYGIAATSGSYTNIFNNTVGSITMPNSLYSSNNATSTQSVYGISVVAGIRTNINNNTVVNITNNYTGTSTGYLRGINLTSSTTSFVTNNKVSNLASNSAYTSSGTTSAVIGILVSTANPSTVTDNRVDSIVLSNATSTAASYIEGLVISLNGSTPTNVIARNFIHHLYASGVNQNTTLVGIDIIGGSNIIANNMVQLGTLPSGYNFTNTAVIRGIYLNTTTATNLYHNSIYIGGDTVGSTVKHSVGFYRNAASGTHEFKNNIVYNNRSNVGVGGKHYVLFLNTVTGLSLANNLYYGAGVGYVFATANNGTSDIATFISGWSGADVNSSFANPQFMNPTGGSAGSASVVDLHINPSVTTPVESAGVLLASITDDYDGQARSAFSPTDIGADAGNFLSLGMTIDSSNVDQVTTIIPTGTQNQAIIALRIHANGAVNPINVLSLKFNTAGTTNTANISNARVYYTGSSNVLSTATQYGSTVVAPNGTFYISGTKALSPGVNYFWLTYDIAVSATPGNFVDARVDSIGLSLGINPSLINGDPFGARTIAASLNGSYNVGAGQTYTTITAALADLSVLGLSGPVTLNLVDASYATTTGETFPININTYTGMSNTNKLTIQPGPGNVATIISANAGSTINLDASKYFVINGMQGGTGTSRSLIVQNDNVGGSALSFINDATANIIKHAVFRGASTNSTIGVVNFGTGVVTGNDSNLIDNCDIADAASLPATLVQGRGSFDALTKFNNDNVISNCNLYNFSATSGETNAFKISKGNTNWTITNNSVYQTVPRAFNVIHYLMNWNRIVDGGTNVDDAMAQASLNNMIVTNNYIGGSAPLCGGTPWTQTASTGQFNSYFNVGNQTATTVKNNTFANFNITSTSAFTGTPGVWNAFQYIGGKVNIDSNLIGSLTDSNSIIINAASGAIVFPIALTANVAGSYTVRGNKIAGIRVSGSGTAAVNIYSIYIASATNTVSYQIDGNIIGGTAGIANLTSSSTTAQVNYGINNISTAILTINNNTISNLNNYHNTIGNSQTIGIRTTAGNNAITNNVINSLANNSAQLSTGINAPVIGISMTSATATNTISRNNIATINHNNLTEATQTIGIYYAGATGDIIDRNTIHSFNTLSSSVTASQIGLQIAGGTARIYNNVVRLGVDSNGYSLTSTPILTGILISGGNARVIYNTVYLSGVVASGAGNTFAVSRTSTGSDSLFNNLFINNRIGGTGNHYAINAGSNTGLTSNYNNFNTYSTYVGMFASVNQAALFDWQTASSTDANSASKPVYFVNSGASASFIDFHLTGTSLGDLGLIAKPVGGITTDFDNQARDLTKPYMGADENLSNPLPVKLITFSANLQNKDVLLTWATAMEQNNKGFELQRSFDAKTFETIGFVKGKGNSNKNEKYSFTDVNVKASNNNVIYYRLKQIDYDAQFTYSPVVKISTEEQQALFNVSGYPNPIKDEYYVSINAVNNANVTLQLFDLQGKVVLSQSLVLTKGTNVVKVDNIDKMQLGVYLLHLTMNGETQIIKVVKN